MTGEETEKSAIDSAAMAYVHQSSNDIKKRKKHRLLVLIAACIMIVVATPFIRVNDAVSEIRAAAQTKKFMNLLMEGDYAGAADKINFWGYTWSENVRQPFPSSDRIFAERQRFIDHLTVFFGGDIRLVGYSDIHFDTYYGDDFYQLTSGTVLLNLKTTNDAYCLQLTIVPERKKISISEVRVVSSSNYEMAENIADELFTIVFTYNPG